MVTLAFSVTTAPRPVPTLRRSLASLRAAGIDAPVIVSADGDHEPVWGLDVELVEQPARLTVLEHRVEALRLLVERTEASHLVVLQDDVTWAAGSGDFIARTLSETAPFWTWYVDPKVARSLEREYGRKHRTLRPGAYLSSLGFGSNGALCYGFARDFAERLLSSHELAAYLQQEAHALHDDHVVPACCLALGEPLQVWVPGLINHSLGSGNSSIKVKPPKDTPYWEAVAS